jgi:hypothetical protein
MNDSCKKMALVVSHRAGAVSRLTQSACFVTLRAV